LFKVDIPVSNTISIIFINQLCLSLIQVQYCPMQSKKCYDCNFYIKDSKMYKTWPGFPHNKLFTMWQTQHTYSGLHQPPSDFNLDFLNKIKFNNVDCTKFHLILKLIHACSSLLFTVILFNRYNYWRNRKISIYIKVKLRIKSNGGRRSRPLVSFNVCEIT